MRRLWHVVTILILILMVAGCEDSSVEETEGSSSPSATATPTPTPAPPGSVTGRVVNGLTGLPLAGVTVYIVGRQAETSVTTNGSGIYTITDTTSGACVIEADLTGYTSDVESITIPIADTLDDINLSLLPSSFANGKLAILLTWAALPTDLDSHLYIPNGGPFELFYGAPGDTDGTLDASPFAGLDLDDTDGEGPETISVQLSGLNPYYAGTYRYYVHNWSQEATFPNSGATVKLYYNGTLVKTYTVPSSGTGVYWHVFDLNGTTFTDTNTITNVQPTAPP